MPKNRLLRTRTLPILCLEESGEVSRLGLDNSNYVSWAYEASSDTVTLTLQAALKPGEWIAIGLSSNQAMPNSDVLHAGITLAGEPVFTDR